MNRVTKRLFISSTITLIRLIIISSGLYGLNSHAQWSSISQTQNQLKKLDIQIHHIKQHLTSANDKQITRQKELSIIEKQIGTGVQTLRQMGLDKKNKEIKIAALQEKINDLNKQLTRQQQLLASHIRTRYQMGEYQPIKWALNQNDPQYISRLLTYYQYIIKSRQQLIEQIDSTRIKIHHNQAIVKREVLENQKLQMQLTQQQLQLTKNKEHQTILIHKLNQDIQNNQTSLVGFEKNKRNLTTLLKSLSQQSMMQVSKPFAQMRKKLPLPVQMKQRAMKRMNQGVTFFADEGAVVTAIYPGRVVFSDWLKGYGLLLIIDHGQGFMTLYAHNQSLFKRTGEKVSQNEQIASVGHSGGIKQNGLYFEIRQKGKSIPPIDWFS